MALLNRPALVEEVATGGGGGGSGDVVGPASAVNNRLAAFDGTTGKLLKDSGALATDFQPLAAVLTNTTASFLAADETKLDGIEAGADVTDAANVAAAGAAMLAAEDQTITGGAGVTSKSLGTISTGTLTLDMGDRPLQHYTNNGAHTLAPGAVTGSAFIDITNGASAGAITTTGWTLVDGDAFTTTNGHKFRCFASVGNVGSILTVKALQ